MNEFDNTLGTIAKSGTNILMKAMRSGDDMGISYQFGVGCYFVYVVFELVAAVQTADLGRQVPKVNLPPNVPPRSGRYRSVMAFRFCCASRLGWPP